MRNTVSIEDVRKFAKLELQDDAKRQFILDEMEADPRLRTLVGLMRDELPSALRRRSNHNATVPNLERRRMNHSRFGVLTPSPSPHLLQKQPTKTTVHFGEDIPAVDATISLAATDPNSIQLRANWPTQLTPEALLFVESDLSKQQIQNSDADDVVTLLARSRFHPLVRDQVTDSLFRSSFPVRSIMNEGNWLIRCDGSPKGCSCQI